MPAGPALNMDPTEELNAADAKSAEAEHAADDASEKFRRVLSRAMLLPLGCLGTLVLVFLGLIGLLLWAGHWARHSEQVVAQINGVQKLLVDMESGLRGYELRDDRTFLQPYLQALPQLNPASAELAALVSDNAQQSQRLTAATAAARRWTGWADSVLQRMDGGGGEASDGAARGGKADMDAVRDQLAAMLDAERDLRDARAARVWRTVIAGGIGSLLLAGVLGFFLVRRTRRQFVDVATGYAKVIRLSRRQDRELKHALELLDLEMKAVGQIQLSLLPKELPDIPTLEMAAHYEASTRAGGDYYDFFPLAHAPLDPGEPDGDPTERWGILMADVSGHGTPAAVVMAITHAIAHGFEHPPMPASHLLNFVNKRLCSGYTSEQVMFVTAFYGIYNPQTRKLIYSSAGHNPPRIRRAGTKDFHDLGEAQGMPLGLDAAEQYPDSEIQLDPGDVLAIYTDGITEARNDDGQLSGIDLLDRALGEAVGTPQEMIDRTLAAVERHAAGREADDDRTLIVARVV